MHNPESSTATVPFDDYLALEDLQANVIIVRRLWSANAILLASQL